MGVGDALEGEHPADRMHEPVLPQQDRKVAQAGLAHRRGQQQPCTKCRVIPFMAKS